MKNYVFSLMALLIAFASFGQNKVHFVEIKTKDVLSNFDYKIVRVIDNRLVKSNIGVAQKGINNKKVVAKFPKPFELYMTSVLQSIISKKDNSKELILVFNELNVSEQTKAFSEIGQARVQMGFLKSVEGKLVLLGEFESQKESRGLDVTNKHDERILSAIKDCFDQFKQFADYESEGEPFELNQKLKLDYTKTLPKGLYATHTSLIQKKPSNLKNYILEKKGTKKFPKYFLKDSTNVKIKRRMAAISDGISIYIHASRYSYGSHYVKSKEAGRYIYFEDKFYVPDLLAEVAFGLIAVAAGNIGRGVILDTQTGLVHVLDDRVIFDILTDFPILKERYQQSNKSLSIMRGLIISVNKKIK